MATSRDLVHWTKRGLAFADAGGGKFHEMWSKSGAILTRRNGDHLVATKINGQYWMLLGRGRGPLATSPDLIHWDPVLDANGNIRDFRRRGRGKFDSDLAEGGPPAVLLPQGVVVLYNGKNSGSNGDPAVPPGGLFRRGGAVRSEGPDAAGGPWITRSSSRGGLRGDGSDAAGTVFVEGLVTFHRRWHLYYGTADTDVWRRQRARRRGGEHIGKMVRVPHGSGPGGIVTPPPASARRRPSRPPPSTPPRSSCRVLPVVATSSISSSVFP